MSKCNVTRIFEEFIKGITYFSNEKETTTPIYHRMYACGPFADTHRLGNLICTQNLTKQEIKRRRPLIERCYIERLIYDAIYKLEALHFPETLSEYFAQDKGHVERLELTRQDFATCFPNTKITCDVFLEDGYPMKLVITKQTKTKETILTFEKYVSIDDAFGAKIYTDATDCIKKENGKEYFKISEFTDPGKFTLIK